MRLLRSVVCLLFITLFAATSSSSAVGQTKAPNAFAENNEFGAVNSKKSHRPASSMGQKEKTDVAPVQSVALLVDDGISYTYVRACTAGAGNALDPATCPRMDAQCDAQDDGIRHRW